MSTEDLLTELVGFLAPSNRTDVRAMAATHIAELSGGDVLSAGPKAKQIWESQAIPQLVRWLGDSESVASPCRAALANLSAISLFFPASAAIAHRKEFWRWLIDDVKGSGPLLVNLTSHPNGPDKVEEHILGGTNRACAELLGTFAVSKDVQVREWCMAAVRNLTTHEGARRGLTDSKPSLKVLLESAALGSTTAQRRDAAGTLRNLLVNKDAGVHGRVLSADGAGWLTAGLILGLGADACPPFSELSATLSEERREWANMSPTLTSMFKGELTKRASLDPDRDHRDLLVDCLLLLASMRSGREKLREVKVYPAVRAYHPLEKDEAINDKVYDLVDFLIQDEDNWENDQEKEVSTNAASASSSDAAWAVD